MFISRLKWEQDGDEDDSIKHTIVDPSWDDIQKAFLRLDGQTYPAMFLACDDQLVSFPSLTVLGGPDEYAVSLERVPANGRGAFERLQLINPTRFKEPHSDVWRGIGKGYHNFEVEMEFLTPDKDLILTVIKHFTDTGRWYPQAPFIVEAEDEEGEWRRYVA